MLTVRTIAEERPPKRPPSAVLDGAVVTPTTSRALCPGESRAWKATSLFVASYTSMASLNNPTTFRQQIVSPFHCHANLTFQIYCRWTPPKNKKSRLRPVWMLPWTLAVLGRHKQRTWLRQWVTRPFFGSGSMCTSRPLGQP